MCFVISWKWNELKPWDFNNKVQYKPKRKVVRKVVESEESFDWNPATPSKMVPENERLDPDDCVVM